MSESNRLAESFNQTSFQLSGHGKWNVSVLKEAFEKVDEQLDSDRYGTGKIIEDFQTKMAVLTGKEAAVFFPSGTMAQQIALRIWCDEKALKKVAYHPLSHLEVHEEDGLKELHNIQSVLLADKSRVIELEDVTGLEEEIACLLLELPQREIGGQLPSFESLEQIVAYCQEKGIKLHLDGARLLEVLPYYNKSAAEVCALFDSVYLSVYKGIGGIAGAVLAGASDFIAKVKLWKRRYGGDLISLYPYIVSADYYYERRADKMGQYYEDAKELAVMFNGCHGVSTLPLEPVSNMFHVQFQHPKAQVAELLSDIHQQTGIGIANYLKEVKDARCSYEVSLGDMYREIPKNQLIEAFQLLEERMKQPL
ncbi:beta-eliminating lyase-related protein [Planococcus sp. N028]|uniref:Beta-eliminating lyase-related protein n=1 Tax=Planococcus shixiaomingii TaxID=3058393 RepID=A0ABT8N171_9BACL|nr:beta-eliminating lyase-related protein [Planococcus sp. N028]MDN7241614.1 beta-eliminating lyase-related protein [Planococcus sp. N028]